MTDVLLLSGSVPARSAALELAEVGVKVWIADVPSQLPSAPVRDPHGTVAQLLDELAAPIADGGHEEPGVRAVRQPEEPVLLRAYDGSLQPKPEPAPWGIPTVPLARDSLAVLGTGGAMRAYLDRLKPVLTIGKQENLAKLVKSRLGAQVLKLLVEPLVRERYGRPATEVDVAEAAPGLNESLTRAGSLSGGALLHLERHVARETLVAPADGWLRFGEVLLERLGLYGAERLDAAIVGLEAADNSTWRAHDETGRTRSFDAIITGPGDALPSSSELFGEISALAGSAVREYAEFGIEAPEAAGENADTALLMLATSSAGSTWAARVRRGADGAWSVLLSGPVRDRHEDATPPAVLEALVRDLGLSPTQIPQTVSIEPAPFATRAEQEASEKRLHDWAAAHQHVLACGTQLFGGELSEAIGDARQRAVHLRRRLLGIAE